MPSKSEVMMEKIKVNDGADLSGHLVAVNQLLIQLNQLARQTYKPNYATIASVASQIKMHVSVIEGIAKRENK
jgi:hypothetical protein